MEILFIKFLQFLFIRVLEILFIYFLHVLFIRFLEILFIHFLQFLFINFLEMFGKRMILKNVTKLKFIIDKFGAPDDARSEKGSIIV